MEFEPVIGLEVHAQLSTQTKIFCGCSTKFGAPPNENTCPVCLGMPGALPVINSKVVELALRAALALDCKIPSVSLFARKNYFYPDLPKGYQISQYDQPLAINGHLQIQSNGDRAHIRIRRVHLEEDAGKLLHEGIESKSESTYVDFNRSGAPLIEIVTEPDVRSPADAYLFLKELKAILKYCEISAANMEEGNLRCDANVSLRERGSSIAGTKVEIKNLNSFKNVQKALEHEIERQQKMLAGGKVVIQETRLFDAAREITASMRSKEEAHDYRYFPEPDLPALNIPQDLIQSIRTRLPELPQARRERFTQQYQLTPGEASVLTDEKAMADYFEEAVALCRESKQVSNWLQRDLLEKLKEHNLNVEDSPIRPRQIADLIDLIKKGMINSNQAREIFLDMWTSKKNPIDIMHEKGITQVSDEKVIEQLIRDVFTQNPEIVQRFQKGETKLLGVLVGLVIKSSGGKANPAVINRLLKEKLG